MLGFLTFLSVFVSGALNFGDFTDFEAQGRSMALRAVLGMAMMIGGGILAGVGRAGLAGSGVKLDPRQARRDLEPFSRQTGGMIADAVDEFRGGSKPRRAERPHPLSRVRRPERGGRQVLRPVWSAASDASRLVARATSL